jgi:hypothetical protein
MLALNDDEKTAWAGLQMLEHIPSLPMLPPLPAELSHVELLDEFNIWEKVCFIVISFCLLLRFVIVFFLLFPCFSLFHEQELKAVIQGTEFEPLRKHFEVFTLVLRKMTEKVNKRFERCEAQSLSTRQNHIKASSKKLTALEKTKQSVEQLKNRNRQSEIQRRISASVQRERLRRQHAYTWRLILRSQTNERGPWSSVLGIPLEKRPKIFWKTDFTETRNRIHSKLKINYQGHNHRVWLCSLSVCLAALSLASYFRLFGQSTLLYSCPCRFPPDLI